MNQCIHAFNSIFYKKLALQLEILFFAKNNFLYSYWGCPYSIVITEDHHPTHDKEHFRSTYFIACENSQHFMTQPVVSTRNDIWGMSAENSILIIHHYLHVHLGSASDWLKFASTKHKHYPDMGSDVLSAWNLCAILWRNLWWCRKVLPVFSSYIF